MILGDSFIWAKRDYRKVAALEHRSMSHSFPPGNWPLLFDMAGKILVSGQGGSNIGIPFDGFSLVVAEAQPSMPVANKDL